MSHNFFDTYAFSSFTPTFLVIYGDQQATDIGCVSAVVTPDLGNMQQLVSFLPLVVLILTGVGVVFASIWSPWGSTNIFHWSSNYGRDADLLRLVTPGFGDCLQYIQFIVLTGSLSLNYPGFYQPIVSQISWSALMFNHSIVTNSDPWQSVVDGIYVSNSSYGLQRNGQLVGMALPEDIWAGMMAWLCVIIAGVTVMIQAGFFFQWIYRKINSDSEEDLREKNLPFTLGNVVRIVFNYFLLPVVSLSAFQLIVSWDSPKYTVALASLTIVVLVGFAVWLLWVIVRTRPKSVLFDDLPTVLRYGSLYNTYSDHSAAFTLVPVLLTFVRGIAIGGVQPNGITQVVLLAICEVVYLLTLHAIRPFHSPTSMNAYHTVFSAVRLITVMFMLTFAQPLGVSEGTKGWIGYVILTLHAAVLALGFFINALQTIFEVLILMLGAGGDDDRGLTRGGLSRIFGMRQLSRRVTPRGNTPSRISYLSTSGMLDAEEGTAKSGYSMPNGRLRSDSAGSYSGILLNNQRSPSALTSYSSRHRQVDSGSSYLPGTPGHETSIFSFLGSPTRTRGQHPAIPLEAADPYYRPPRRRRDTVTNDLAPDSLRGSLSSDPRRLSGPQGPLGDVTDLGGENYSRDMDAPRAPDLRPPEISRGADISRGATPAPAGLNTVSNLPHRPDYSTREVDFYYGVRGPALNSDAPGRRLGTGPADPTGPVATASGWFRNLFGGKTKEKGKGFEVVRSARMPPAMMARNNAGFGDETPPEGIPVAMGVLRNGPIDSDDDEPKPKPKSSPKKPGDLLTDAGEPAGRDDDELVSPVSDGDDELPSPVTEDDVPDSPVTARLPRGSLPPQPRILTQQASSDDLAIPRKSSKRNSALIQQPSSDDLAPEVPRKSSKRNSSLFQHSRSASATPPVSCDDASSKAPSHTSSYSPSKAPSRAPSRPQLPRLPFERTESQRTGSSSMGWSIDLGYRPSGRSERPTSFGVVSQHSVDLDHSPIDLLGSSAEMVDERSASKKGRKAK